jgi:diguanylate cyclase (GGDEF)-like protein
LARVRAALNLKQELDRRRARERQLVEVTRELERVNGQLRRLAVQDELTGVPNRRYFNWLLGREWGRAARDGRPLGLVLADVDLFKAFNDTYGHLAGDSCLAQVAAALTRQVHRSADAVARYGGEEFAVVLPNTDAAGAATVAEGLRAAVAGIGLEHGGSPHRRVTVSLGAAAVVPGPGTSSDALVRAADEALYRAKEGGRDRVALAAGPEKAGNGKETVSTA